MYENSPSRHAANIHSYKAVPAYHWINREHPIPQTSPLTTYDLLSLLRQDCLVIMISIEAEAEETEEQHAKIRQLYQEIRQLKGYYLNAIPLFDHGDTPEAA